jgi:acyl-CoA synthetase (AMP-forming)/AMP-acid ligase II
MESICPDTMMLTTAPAYVTYALPPLDLASAATFTDTTDPTGCQKKALMAHSKLLARNKSSNCWTRNQLIVTQDDTGVEL